MIPPAQSKVKLMNDENRIGGLGGTAMARRWTPRSGKPTNRSERIMQKIVKVLARLDVYTAIIATLTLLAVVFGFPFVGR